MSDERRMAIIAMDVISMPVWLRSEGGKTNEI